MKKLLFGLLALSAVTFAANPGTDTTADMQVEAKLTVVDATGKLVVEELTDAGTWKVVSSVVAFDHGTVTKGSTAVPEPSILKNFRVRKLNASGENDELLGNVAVTLGGDKTGEVQDTLTSGAQAINHIFRFNPAPLVGTDKTAQFNIESNIPSLTGTEEVGVYNRVATVAVSLIPASTLPSK